MTEDKLRLAVVQPRAVRPEGDNVERAVAYARQAADQGAQIVAFPECYPGPYSGPVDFDAAQALGSVAREYQIYVGYGFMETAPAPADADRYHNIYQVIGPDGGIAVKYIKMIPLSRGPGAIQQGDHPWR